MGNKWMLFKRIVLLIMCLYALIFGFQFSANLIEYAFQCEEVVK